MAAEFTHRGAKYRAERIDAMRQFHVVRRLLPVLAEVVAGMGQAGDDKTAAAVAGVANALGKLTDADSEYVLHTLLSHVCVERTGWHKVSNGSQIMYAELTMPDLLYLAYRALQENLGDFFAAVPSDLKAAFLKANNP